MHQQMYLCPPQYRCSLSTLHVSSTSAVSLSSTMDTGIHAWFNSPSQHYGVLSVPKFKCLVNLCDEGVNLCHEGVNLCHEGVNSRHEGVNLCHEGVNSCHEGVNLS